MRKIFLLLFFYFSLFSSEQYSYRKYSHVKDFYTTLTPKALEISHKYHLPPAAVLSIAGLESGYGSGYVSRITGNILSLGAFKSDYELPALYLPACKTTGQVLFDPKNIKKCSPQTLEYKKRPKSLKRDYRPSSIAGTAQELAYFKYHPKEKSKAQYKCLEDFATRWIIDTSSKKPFLDARVWLDGLVKKKGEKILYAKETNEKFIKMIGGKPHSFNYRKEWPKKALQIMNKTGLVELCRDMYVERKKVFKRVGIRNNSKFLQDP